MKEATLKAAQFLPTGVGLRGRVTDTLTLLNCEINIDEKARKKEDQGMVRRFRREGEGGATEALMLRAAARPRARAFVGPCTR